MFDSYIKTIQQVARDFGVLETHFSDAAGWASIKSASGNTLVEVGFYTGADGVSEFFSADTYEGDSEGAWYYEANAIGSTADELYRLLNATLGTEGDQE